MGIVLDVDTGAVLAMATIPAFDPNQPRVVYDEAQRAAVDALEGEERAAALQQAQQVAVAQQGSQRSVRAGQRVQAHHLRGGAGRRGRPARRHLCLRGLPVGVGHPLPLRQPQAARGADRHRSADELLQPEFHPDRARLGKQAFCDYFAAFGLREATGIDLPAEPAHSLYYTADRMGPVELASCSFGQSSKVSYIGMAAAVAAIVNGGRLMRPYVVAEVRSPAGAVLQTAEPACVRQVIRPRLRPSCAR